MPGELLLFGLFCVPEWNEVEQEGWNKNQSGTSRGCRRRRWASPARCKVEQLEQEKAVLVPGLFHLK